MLEVVDNPQRSQYEVFVDGELVGFAAYNHTPDGVLLPHAEVRQRTQRPRVRQRAGQGRARRHPPPGPAGGAAVPVHRRLRRPASRVRRRGDVTAPLMPADRVSGSPRGGSHGPLAVGNLPTCHPGTVCDRDGGRRRCGRRDAGGLRRSVGFWGLMFVSLGSIIGSGWLLGALSAAQAAGPAAIMSWVIAAAMLTCWRWSSPNSARPIRSPVAAAGSRTTRTARSPGSPPAGRRGCRRSPIAPIEIVAAITYVNSVAGSTSTSTCSTRTAC